MNLKLKEQAIALRRQGLTYSEILVKIPVAKSTLSDWLHSVGLAKKEFQRLTQKKLESAKKGGEARRAQRLAITKEIMDAARKEIGMLSDRELWLIGVSLYWAEGMKEKPYSRGYEVRFSNSDHRMIKMFVQWLVRICKVPREDIYFSLFIHENNKFRVPEVKEFWKNVLDSSEDIVRQVYFKKHNPKTIRKNTGEAYYGVIQLRVSRSISLNRKIAGWTEGVLESLR